MPRSCLLVLALSENGRGFSCRGKSVLEAARYWIDKELVLNARQTDTAYSEIDTGHMFRTVVSRSLMQVITVS